MVVVEALLEYIIISDDYFNTQIKFNQKIKLIIMEEIIIEIRDAEGGEDSKLLVNDMSNIYLRWSNNNNVDFKVLESRSGFISI